MEDKSFEGFAPHDELEHDVMADTIADIPKPKSINKGTADRSWERGRRELREFTGICRRCGGLTRPPPPSVRVGA